MALVSKTIQHNQAGWIGQPQGCNQGRVVLLLIGQVPTARPPHPKQNQGVGPLRRQGLEGLGPEGRQHRAARPFRHQGAPQANARSLAQRRRVQTAHPRQGAQGQHRISVLDHLQGLPRSQHLQDGIELIPEEMGKIFVAGPHNRRPQRGAQPVVGAWGLERLARQGITVAALAGEQHLHESVLAAAEQQAVAIQIGPAAHQVIGAIVQLEPIALAPKNPVLVAADGARMDPAIQDLEVHRWLVRRGRASRCCQHLPGADRCLLEA